MHAWRWRSTLPELFAMNTDLFPNEAPTIIRVISLWQPWAQWVMLGWKTIETRTHRRFAGLRGHRIGIHATLKWDDQWQAQAGRFLNAEQRDQTHAMAPSPGQILGTVDVSAVRWLTAEDEAASLIECTSVRRFGMFLESPVRFPEGIPAKGGQGIWKFRLPQAK